MGRSQLFVSVGDATFDEFVPPYYARWYEHFGLGYFGCCDPLHNRIDSVRKIPNVRKISISAWAKVEKAAEGIGPDFVYSRKPNPAMVAMDEWVPAIAEKDFTDVLDGHPRQRLPGRVHAQGHLHLPNGSYPAVGVVRHRGAHDPRVASTPRTRSDEEI